MIPTSSMADRVSHAQFDSCVLSTFIFTWRLLRHNLEQDGCATLAAHIYLHLQSDLTMTAMEETPHGPECQNPKALNPKWCSHSSINKSNRNGNPKCLTWHYSPYSVALNIGTCGMSNTCDTYSSRFNSVDLSKVQRFCW